MSKPKKKPKGITVVNRGTLEVVYRGPQRRIKDDPGYEPERRGVKPIPTPDELAKKNEARKEDFFSPPEIPPLMGYASTVETR